MKTKIATITLLMLSLVACHNMDYRDLDKNIKINSSLAMPVGYSKMTIFDILSKVNDRYLVKDSASNNAYLQLTNTFSLGINDYVLNHLNFNTQNSFSFGSLINGALPQTVNSSNVDVFNTMLSKIENGEFEFKLNNYENGNLAQRIDHIGFKNLTLRVNATAKNIQGLSSNGGKIKTEFSFPQIPSLASRIFTFYIDADSKAEQWELGAFDISFLESEKPLSKTLINIAFSVVCPDGSTITFNPNADIETKIEFADMKFNLIKGWFNTNYTVSADKLNIDLPIDFFKSKTLQQNKLFFYNPIISFKFSNNIGIPLNFNVNYVVCKNDAGEEIRGDFNGSESVMIPLKKPTDTITEGISIINFDRNFGGTNKFFKINPDKIEYDFNVSIDHNIAIQDLANKTQHFLEIPSHINVEVNSKLPFHLDAESRYFANDTIKNINIDSTLNAIGIDFEKLELNITFKNHLPIQAVANISFLNSSDIEMYNISDIKIDCPSVDGNGFAINDIIKTIDIDLSKRDVAQIRYANKIVIKYEISGKTATDQINFRGTDWIQASLAIFIKGSFSKNLDSLTK